MPAPYSPDYGRPRPRTLGDLLMCEHIGAECLSCRHRGDVTLKPLVLRHGPAVTLNEIWRRLRCSRCGGGARFPPRIVSSDPKAVPSWNLRNYWQMIGRGRAGAVA